MDEDDRERPDPPTPDDEVVDGGESDPEWQDAPAPDEEEVDGRGARLQATVRNRKEMSVLMAVSPRLPVSSAPGRRTSRHMATPTQAPA